MFRCAALVLLPLLGACAARVAPPPVVATLPPPAPRPPLPEGATPGMAVPAPLADGSFPTPNRWLTPAATLWHLRSGLNVAALACRGPDGTAVVAGYNGWLRTRAAALKAAEAALAAEYRARAAAGEPATAWRVRYDGAMTRLYNYWSQGPARTGLCAASLTVLAEVPGVAPDAMAAAAPGWLARLDRPVTDFYAAYDAWRGWSAARVAAAPVPAGPPAAVPLAVPRAVPAAPPWLTVDPSVFRE